jgi:hypothetical protein
MQQMQKFFPLIFGLIYLRVPAGATIYMVVSSAMRIGTQEVMFRSGMVEPVAVEREIGPTKEDKPPPKPPPKEPKRSGATDGTSAAKGTVAPKGNAAPKAGTGSNGRSNANGRKPAARKANGKSGAEEPAPPAPKAHPRSRSKRARKAR